jgi:hypothetical protein
MRQRMLFTIAALVIALAIFMMLRGGSSRS